MAIDGIRIMVSHRAREVSLERFAHLAISVENGAHTGYMQLKDKTIGTKEEREAEKAHKAQVRISIIPTVHIFAHCLLAPGKET